VLRLAEEIARLSKLRLEPGAYYEAFLQRVVTAMSAAAGAVWVRRPQGTWQVEYQINMKHSGLEGSRRERQMHAQLLRQATVKGPPWILPPKAELSASECGGIPVSNPSDYTLLIAPIWRQEQVVGLVEVCQETNREPAVLRGYMQFLLAM